MTIRKNLGRLLGLLLAIAMLLTTAEGFTVKTSAAEAKTTTEYFAYRVDVMDAKKGSNDNIAVQLLSSIDGRAYVYVMYAGEEKPTVKTIMGSGNDVYLTAGEENEVYGHIYSSKSIKVGEKYDIYIVFEDPAHNTYGPFTVKKWVAKYFPAGSGTKKKPYQIWTARHLFNMTKYTGEDYKGKYFKVMQDIDLSESIYSGRVCSYASTFYGIFDGNGKTIRGLVGNLFDNLESTAIVRNVYVAGADTTRGSSGGIAGVICENNKGIIEKCVVYNSELSCSSYHGIIAGFNNEVGIIRNCASVDCKDYAYDAAGGIVGRNEGKVQNCYSNITVKGDSTCGGIVGINFGGTVSGCLGTITTIPRKDTPNPSQNIGGIVGVQAGSDAFIENCTSLYLPEDIYDLGDVGSIWGGYNTGGYGYPENAIDCVGAVKYTLDDINLTEKEINGSTNETYLAEQLQQKRTRFVSHHGASSDTKKAENPVKKTIAGGNPDGKNKAVISNLSIKYTHIFENETKAYNAKKKFPMTQKELKVKEYSAPGKVKIKKVKVDSKNGQATLTWDSVKKAEGYEVYITDWTYAETGGKYGEYELEKTIDSANVNEYLDKYLYANHIYYYKVRAYYKVNGIKVYGPFSEVKEVVIVKE
ncbi:MAG: hypothetical protein K6G45_12810 [Lachnospiraceae bacterium]|nr:hypothetical protein [Lachnospiraceae bacterium]